MNEHNVRKAEAVGGNLGILNWIKRIPGGLLLVPMMITAVIHTFCPELVKIGGATELLFTNTCTMYVVGLMPVSYTHLEEDIRRLKKIKLFRKLGMPIGDIRRLFIGEISLEEAITAQISRLQTEKETVLAALKFCGKIQETQLAEMDESFYLEQMEEEEQKGSVFVQFAEDYISVRKAELEREMCIRDRNHRHSSFGRIHGRSGRQLRSYGG